MKRPICCVAAASPAAQVNVSNDHSRTLVRPPKPRQRAMGRKNSMPARSAMPTALRLSSQLARHRSGTVVIANPPSALLEKTPSLKRFGPFKGWGFGMGLLGVKSGGDCAEAGQLGGRLIHLGGIRGILAGSEESLFGSADERGHPVPGIDGVPVHEGGVE